MNIKSINIKYYSFGMCAYVSYENNGVPGYEMLTNIDEINEWINTFVNQAKMPFDILKTLGYITEDDHRDYSLENYDIRYNSQPHASSDYNKDDGYLQGRNNREAKYTGRAAWCKSTSRYNDKIINIGRSKIKIKPLLLALLVAGGIGLSLNAIGNSKNAGSASGIKIVETIDYNIKIDVNLINEVMNDYVSGKEIGRVRMERFVTELEKAYSYNFYRWQKGVSQRLKHGGVIFNFSKCYKENGKDYSTLEKYESKYNELVHNYAKSVLGYSSTGYDNFQILMPNLCSDMYFFIFNDDGNFYDLNPNFNKLDPMIKLIVSEMYLNCLDTMDDSFGVSKTGYYSPKLNQKFLDKKRVIGCLKLIIDECKLDLQRDGKTR